MPSTPHDRFEYPPAEDPLWYKKGMKRSDLSEQARKSIPPEYFEQRYEGFVDWLESLEISVQGMVRTRGDLPTPDPDETATWTLPNGNDATQRRVFIILNEDAIVYDNGTSWETLAGLGSADNPLPPIHTETVNANSVNSSRVSGGDVEANTYKKRGAHAYSPRLIGHHRQLGEGALNVSFDTRAYSDGDLMLTGNFSTISTQGPTTVKIRISGYAGTQYQQINMTGTGITNTVDLTEWNVGNLIQQYGFLNCRYHISRPRSRPAIHGSAVAGASAFTEPTLARGVVRGTDVFSIDTVDVFTPDPIQLGDVELWGHVQGEY